MTPAITVKLGWQRRKETIVLYWGQYKRWKMSTGSQELFADTATDSPGDGGRVVTCRPGDIWAEAWKNFKSLPNEQRERTFQIKSPAWIKTRGHKTIWHPWEYLLKYIWYGWIAGLKVRQNGAKGWGTLDSALRDLAFILQATVISWVSFPLFLPSIHHWRDGLEGT